MKPPYRIIGLSLLLCTTNFAIAADLTQKRSAVIRPLPGQPAFPDPFVSTPFQSANLPLTRVVTQRGVLLKFDGGNSPATGARMYDPRLAGSAYYGLISQEVNNFRFTAVRTRDRLGNDRSTVNLSAVSFNNRWTPRHPRTGAIYSRSGFDLDFRRGSQVLLTVSSNRNGYIGNLNICGQGPDRLTINEFDIPNDVFEAIDNVEFRGKPELYLGCP